MNWREGTKVKYLRGYGQKIKIKKVMANCKETWWQYSLKQWQ